MQMQRTKPNRSDKETKPRLGKTESSFIDFIPSHNRETATPARLDTRLLPRDSIRP
jgi:hypothetical protein